MRVVIFVFDQLEYTIFLVHLFLCSFDIGSHSVTLTSLELSLWPKLGHGNASVTYMLVLQM